mgnify:CR=1 FL=1
MRLWSSPERDADVEEMRQAYNGRRRYLLHAFEEMGLPCLSRRRVLCRSPPSRIRSPQMSLPSGFLGKNGWLWCPERLLESVEKDF